MPANTAPIFGLTPNVSGVPITATNTKSDGSGTIGTDIFEVFTAGANGAWVSKARVFNTATTVRLFLSSQTSGATTSSNTFLIGELAMPAVTADATATATNPQELPLNFAIPAGWTILASMHQSLAANTGMQATVFGTDY